MSGEPESILIYCDSSASARSIREGICDGPVDTIQFTKRLVFLEVLPSLENGDITFEPFEVPTGNLIADENGNLVQLS